MGNNIEKTLNDFRNLPEAKDKNEFVRDVEGMIKKCNRIDNTAYKRQIVEIMYEYIAKNGKVIGSVEFFQIALKKLHEFQHDMGMTFSEKYKSVIQKRLDDINAEQEMSSLNVKENSETSN